MENNLKNLAIIKLAHKERLTDRYSETQIIELENKGQPTTLIGFVEILSRWNPAREIGITLPQSFARYFNRSTHQSTLTKFEDALKNINSAVVMANQKIDSPISAAIAIHVGNEVYFSTVGKAKILLIRKGKATTVSTGTKDEDSTEFATVTSGELSSTDTMCYGNNEFLDLSKQLTGESDEMEKQVRKLISTNATVETGCVVRIAPANDGGVQTIYVGGSSGSIPLPKLDFSGVLPVLTAAAKKVSTFTTNSVAKTKAAIAARRSEKPAPVITEEESEETEIEDLQINNYSEKPRNRMPLRVKWPTFSKIGILGILILLVLAAGAGYAVDKAIIAHNRKTPPPAPEVPAIITDLQNASATTIPTVIANELTQDRYKYLSDDQITTLNTLVAQASISIIQTPAALFSLPTTAAFVATTPKFDTVFAIDQTGQLYSWDGKKLTTVTQTTAISTPISITALSKTRVLVSDAQGNIYLFDGSDKQPIKVTQPTTWTTGPRYLQNYNGNLYVLTLTDGIVHKVPGFVADIANDTTLITLTPDPADHMLSFLINGDINTLTTKTGLVDHPKTGKPITLVAAGKLSANSTASFRTDNLAVSSGNLISFFNLQGQYQSGKAIVASDKINQIVSDGSKGMLVVIGNNIYLLP